MKMKCSLCFVCLAWDTLRKVIIVPIAASEPVIPTYLCMASVVLITGIFHYTIPDKIIYCCQWGVSCYSLALPLL